MFVKQVIKFAISTTKSDRISFYKYDPRVPLSLKVYIVTPWII
jgi:hypothetical protein